MSNFETLLNAKVEDFDAPPPIPAGTWELQCLRYEQCESSQKKTPGVRIYFALVSAGEDVDSDAMGNFEKHNGMKREIAEEFWFTERALFMLRRMVEKCGVQITGRTFKEALSDLPGCVVKGFIAQVPSRRKGSDAVFNEITNWTEA